MDIADPSLFAPVPLPLPLPPGVGEPAITAAWAAHVAAGRIGAGSPPRAPGPDHGLAGLAAILGRADPERAA